MVLRWDDATSHDIDVSPNELLKEQPDEHSTEEDLIRMQEEPLTIISSKSITEPMCEQRILSTVSHLDSDMKRVIITLFEVQKELRELTTLFAELAQDSDGDNDDMQDRTSYYK